MAQRKPAPVTIADALEHAAQEAGNKPLDVSDARAIQSAEARAAPTGVKGGLGSQAQSAVDRGVPVTIGDVVQDAHEKMPAGANKIVTPADAARVLSAEERNDPTGTATPGGIAACVQSAANANLRAGYVRGNE